VAAAALAAALLLPGRRPGDGTDRVPRGAATVATGDATEAISPSSQGAAAITPEAVDPAEVRRAAGEARLALAYLSRASRRTGLELRDELIDDLLGQRLAGPAAEALRALGMRIRSEESHDET
jgi:hypothetical protein